jgi:nucleotide-binding universal stress UspA family protein
VSSASRWAQIESLARVAEDWSADLVVTGAHGERPGIWEGLGSTAEHLVRISRVPVLLVARPYSSSRSNILVPIDDSEIAAEALGWAGELSRKFGANVTALHVVAAAVSTAALAPASMLSGPRYSSQIPRFA